MSNAPRRAASSSERVKGVRRRASLAGATATCASVRHAADELICLFTPDPFLAVGVYFENFRPIDDDAVKRLLTNAAGAH